MRYVLACTLLSLSFTICAQAWKPNTEIFGSLHQIMSGEADEKVRLNLMGPLTDHYGIGAVAVVGIGVTH